MQRTILISGGANGIGRAMVAYFLRQSCRIAVADHDARAGKRLPYHGAGEGEVLFIPTDVSDAGSVRSCIETVGQRWGTIDALVNNAAISDPDSGPLAELELSRWQQVINTNLTGVFLLSKYALPYLRRPGGAIVNIASTRAHQSEPDTEAYAAAKGGVVALTHAMAMSLGPDIRVNSISPGWINTTGAALRDIDHQAHPAGRVGVPEDVASMVDYLISERAGFITGQDFVIDGGMTRKMIYPE